MVFSSAVFIFLFLPIVFIGNLLIKKEYSNIFLVLSSLFFYAWGEPYLVFLMIISIIINWLIAFLLEKRNGKVRLVILLIGIVSDLGILLYYKYSHFIINIINNILGNKIIADSKVSLPIGISFFTFQAISYIVDVYREKTKSSKNIINVALYISFFPQLIAGPIVKYRDINEQINNRSINWIDVSDGFKRFIYGLGKKVLIANVLGKCVDTIWGFEITLIDSKMAWIGAIAYTFQIYYDFLGYSDMAIGLGKMFGFTIPENFNYPYLSHSISEFWRRWHISLGEWFREYLYIPLGGNRKGKNRTYINLIIVFLLTGLWHGANYTFILWGGYNVLFILIERIGLNKSLSKHRFVSIIYTFLVVNFGWVLFRANDIASGFEFIKRMVMVKSYCDCHLEFWNYINNKTVFVSICSILGMGILKDIIPERIKDIWRNSLVEATFCAVVLLLSLAAIISDTYNPFIYFQF